MARGGAGKSRPDSWCERRDSNSHGLPHWILNPARLPIPPLSQRTRRHPVDFFRSGRTVCWGERWGSNPRPPGSQPGALPTELRSPYTNDTIVPVQQPPGLRKAGTPDRTRTCNLRLSLPTTAFAAHRTRTRGLAVPVQVPARWFVVWTISSPSQVGHV